MSVTVLDVCFRLHCGSSALHFMHRAQTLPMLDCHDKGLTLQTPGTDGGKSVIVKYLTTSKLTRLQLRDAAFRRTLLVQCLILLHACAHPKHSATKPAQHQLKEKQASSSIAAVRPLLVLVSADWSIKQRSLCCFVPATVQTCKTASKEAYIMKVLPCMKPHGKHATVTLNSLLSWLVPESQTGTQLLIAWLL